MFLTSKKIDLGVIRKERTAGEFNICRIHDKQEKQRKQRKAGFNDSVNFLEKELLQRENQLINEKQKKLKNKRNCGEP